MKQPTTTEPVMRVTSFQANEWLEARLKEFLDRPVWFVANYSLATQQAVAAYSAAKAKAASKDEWQAA